MTTSATSARALACAAMLALCVGAQAVQRIAMVLPRPARNTEAVFQNFLRNRGVDAEYTFVVYSGRPEDAPAMVQRLRALKPDLIYTWGGPTTLAVAGPAATSRPQDFIRDIPIVCAAVANPVASGLVESADHPGRNLSGVSDVAPLVAQMRALRSYAALRRLGYILDPRDPISRVVHEELARIAAQSGFELVDETVPLDPFGRTNMRLLRETIFRIARRGADFLYIGPGALLSFTLRDAVTGAALDAKLPTFCATENAIGTPPRCLFGLLPSGPNAGRLAAYKAAQVLLDHVPIERLPIEALDRFTLFINMPVALALQSYPPLELLDTAELIGAEAAGGR
jgi:putative ABC transport system substrate-binding protein